MNITIYYIYRSFLPTFIDHVLGKLWIFHIDFRLSASPPGVSDLGTSDLDGSVKLPQGIRYMVYLNVCKCSVCVCIIYMHGIWL